MVFTDQAQIVLAVAPAGGDNPPSGSIYIWMTIDVFNNIVINYKLSDGTSKVVSSGLSRWTETTGYTATPASTSTLTMTVDKTAVLKVGIPVRYTIGGVVYYGQITAVTANLLTVAGASMGGSVTKLEYGLSEMVQTIDYFVGGVYGDTAEDLLVNKVKTYSKWRMGKAYLVSFSAIEETPDSGTEPKVNVKIDGSAVSTNDSNKGVQLTADNNEVINPAVAVSTSNYDINTGESIEISCTEAGGTGDAENLTVTCIFILE